MQPPVSSFWAKLRPYRGSQVEAWHPLRAHAADVAACTELLLRRSLLGDRLARLGGLDALTDRHVDRLCVLAALHDLGKYNIGFQNRKLADPPFTAGHVREALAAFGTRAGPRIGRALGFESMAGWGADETTFEDLLVTALGHHGRPVSPGGRPTRGAWRATEELDPFEGLSELRDAVEAWYPEAFESDGPPLPAGTHFQHAFNGLLTLADWLGSNETFFPYAENGDGPRITFARDRAGEALRHIGLDPERARRSLIDRPPSFDQVWPFEPRPAQRQLAELPTTEDASFSILEAPTGSGKTEAALIRFLRLFSAGQVDGLYFALPTRAAATQMHGRVREAVEQVISDPEDRPPVIQAVPGYLANDPEDALLEQFPALWPDGDRRWDYLTWARERPKRYLAGTIAVGTVDQVLLSALKVDHAHLRAASLLRHLLVVDEVHASDVYMSSLLETVVDRHLAAGGHAILMSATLGERARRRYLDRSGRTGVEPRPPEQARQFPYPVLVHTERGSAPQEEPIPNIALSEKEVEVELLPALEAPGVVATRALEAAEEGARVLAIRNTIGGCRSLQRALEGLGQGEGDRRVFRCASKPAPHHSRFASPDRELLDGVVEEVFGKDSPVSGVVLSATQTVEQSLDIDGDLLVTDLCPADVLLQRIGRLHRHDRASRPKGFRRARVLVLVPSSRDLGRHIQRSGEHAGHAFGPHGLGTVYEDLRVLLATWSELRDRRSLSLPADNRALVEAATHPDALERVGCEQGGAWQEHAQTMKGVRRARRGQAGLNLADWSVRFGDPDSLFPDRGGERIRTRLGEDDRRAVLSDSVTGPFGRRIDELTLPGWMAPEITEGEEAEVLRSDEEEFAFRFGASRYRYGRLGLEEIESSG